MKKTGAIPRRFKISSFRIFSFRQRTLLTPEDQRKQELFLLRFLRISQSS